MVRFLSRLKRFPLAWTLFGLMASCWCQLLQAEQSPATMNSSSQSSVGSADTDLIGHSSAASSVPRPLIRSEVTKSQRDPRNYRYLVLPNQLKVLLISDPEADKAAAALSVQVGANQNPSEREGLAHFLEHMLFLGTEKYPEAGEYQTFIAQHGGSYNAYTAAENSTYFFDIDTAQLEPALDRFAQFFIAPLFSADYVERERNAVNSEFLAKIRDDGRKEWEVYRELFNPSHPSAKFSVGTSSTLADRSDSLIRDELIAFYLANYSAAQMNLVVVGRESLDQLEQMVVQRFAAVPERERKDEAYPSLFAKHQLPFTVEIQPEKDSRRLTFNFPIPQQYRFYRKKPYEYIGEILGHEGKGSLLSFLKRLGWAEGVTAGVNFASRHDALFQISFDLTPQGVKAHKQMVSLMFYAIEQLRMHGLNSWRYDELQEMAELQFQFADKQPPMETARLLAEAMFYYEPSNVLRNKNLYAAYDERMIKDCLSFLTPENLLLVLTAPEVEPYRISKRYGTAYSARHEIPELMDLKIAVKQQLSLPEHNEFIPNRLVVKTGSMLDEVNSIVEAKPQQIIDSRNARVWYAQDRQFNQPKAVIQLRLKSPLVAANAEGNAQAQLFAALINDQVRDFTYPAELAGVEYSLVANNRGFDLRVGGFSDRQSLLLSKISDAIVRGRFNKERFESIKKKLLRDLANQEKDLPYLVMLRQIAVLQSDPQWSSSELARALESVEFESFSRFADHMLLDAKMDMLIYGNYFRQEAIKLAVLMDHELLARQTGRDLTPARVIGQANTQDNPWLYLHPMDHKDALVTLLITAQTPDVTDVAHMHLLRQILQPEFYLQMRTEQQLGYVVAALPTPLRQLDATAFVVQSPVADEKKIIAAMSKFFKNQVNSIARELDTNRRSLSKKLRMPARSLTEQAERFWSSIDNSDFSFSRRDEIAGAIDRISEQSLQNFYQQQFMQKNRRLWMINHPLDDADNYSIINNVSAYKARQPVFLVQ